MELVMKLTLLKYACLLCCLFANTQSVNSSTTRSYQTRERITDGRFHEIATHIANRILALKGRFSGFESISRAKNIYVREFPFRPIVDYRYRVLRYKPVPDSEPPMETAI